MSRTYRKAGGFAVAIICSLFIAPNASASTCSAMCSATDEAIVAPGSIAESPDNPPDASRSRVTDDSSLSPIRRPGDARGPGFWTN